MIALNQSETNHKECGRWEATSWDRPQPMWPAVAPDSVAAVRDGAAARVCAKARDGEAALSPTTSPESLPQKQTKAT
ncbi:hypothetical protein ISN44_As08g033700 [Arabidopsis suecica]|uniref:Uncharacterized protein n=1 Tax=Arabidopsis suecica TaxID=45249 RepID=A0A8T2BCX1_ARASU|nr:hypothetical protein ISN44_As08g033700 [Arabidopsis suecica]